MADIAKGAGLAADDAALAGASKLFFYLWNTAWEHGAGTLAGDADALHDMRVNLRRLRSAMQNFEGSKRAPVLSRGVRDELRDERRRVGKLGDRLGAVRDYDVLTEYIESYAKRKSEVPLEESAGLTALVAFFASARAAHFEPMTTALQKSLKPGRLREEFGRWALGLPAAHGTSASLQTVAFTLLPRRIDEVFSHAPSLEPGADVEEQHELRKALRRVRYTLETLSVCYQSNPRPFIKKLVQMQDVLGEMQDRAVLEEATRQCFGSDLPPDVALFNEHGINRRRYLLGRIRSLWDASEKDGFWGELRALSSE